MGGIVIAIWEKSNFFGSIGSLKFTKNAIFLQGGQNLPPLPLVGLNYIFVPDINKLNFAIDFINFPSFLVFMQ